METYEKARDIFDYISKYHREIKKMYKEEKEEVNRKRVRMLLDYLTRHEKSFEEGMDRAGRDNGGSLTRRNKLKGCKHNEKYFYRHIRLEL